VHGTVFPAAPSSLHRACNVGTLSTAGSRLVVRLCAGGRGKKLLPAVVTAKVERLSIAFGVDRGGCVHGHAADGVFGYGFRFIHGHVPLLMVVDGC